MSGDDFLSRWSRRKREAARRDAPAPGDAPGRDAPGGAPDAAAAPGAPAAAPRTDAGPTPEGAGPGTPAGDPGEPPPLPALEDITAATDISGFMHPAVPAPLRHAALRRMWSLDPAIRDFVSEAVDYAHDYNRPESIPGFGRLGPADDVARMVANLWENPFKPQPEEEVVPSGRDIASQDEAEPTGAVAAAADADDPAGEPAPSGVETPLTAAEIHDHRAPGDVPEPPAAAAAPLPGPRRHGGAVPV